MSTTVDAKEAKKESKSGITVRVKAALATLMVSLMSLVSMVSAGTLNDTISPILNDVASLFTPLLALIISAVPLIIAVAVISFVTGIFKEIVAKIGV